MPAHQIAGMRTRSPWVCLFARNRAVGPANARARPCARTSCAGRAVHPTPDAPGDQTRLPGSVLVIEHGWCDRGRGVSVISCGPLWHCREVVADGAMRDVGPLAEMVADPLPHQCAAAIGCRAVRPVEYGRPLRRSYSRRIVCADEDGA